MELACDDAALRHRPSADVWSALEYACHVRDVLLVMRERVLQVLREPSPPAFTPMGRDERVRDDRYAEQSPNDVPRQITDAAAMLALADLRVNAFLDWHRLRGLAGGCERTV